MNWVDGKIYSYDFHYKCCKLYDYFNAAEENVLGPLSLFFNILYIQVDGFYLSV
jgi:hypothetical protein